MISDELKSVLIQVITSWQVIGITAALVLYLSLVFYVIQFTGVSNIAVKVKAKPKREKKPPPKPAEEDENAEE